MKDSINVLKLKLSQLADGNEWTCPSCDYTQSTNPQFTMVSGDVLCCENCGAESELVEG